MEGLRGFSALLVFMVHFNSLFGEYASSRALRQACAFLSTMGHCGVDIFFALSGYIIYGHLLEKPVSYAGFARRRMWRLYPVFLVVFSVYLLLYASLGLRDARIPAGALKATAYVAANLLMMPGLFPIIPLISAAWSLSYELYFYLTLPLGMRLLKIAQRRPPLRIAIVAGACLTHLALASTGLIPHPRAAMFSCGILLRETIHLKFPWKRAGNAAALGGFILTLALMGLGSRQVVLRYCGTVASNSTVLGILLFAGTYAVGYFALGDDGILARIFRTDWLRWFGNMSYSYYLAHGMLLHMVKIAGEHIGLPRALPAVPFLATALVSFGVTAVGSAILFANVEKPYSFRRR